MAVSLVEERLAGGGSSLAVKGKTPVPMALLTTSGTPVRGTEKHMTLMSSLQGLMLAAGSPSSL